MSSQTETSTPESLPPNLPGLLVQPSWLQERLATPRLRVVDMRDAHAYASGHIPGAAHVELSALGSRGGGLDNVLLPPLEFGARMAELGISNGDGVVVYDDQWGLAAARLFWALHYYGHERVALLDGGWDLWQSEGRPVAAGVDPVRPGTFEAVPRPEVYADRDWIARQVERGDARLLDTRSQKEFDLGHLPGSVCWDWFNAVPAGSWGVSRDPQELRAEWQALGFNATEEVTVYCRSGMRAAHTYFVLRNAGFSRVRLYDGSWQEWSMKKDGSGGE